MLIIRLRRTGKKSKPTYRIVVAENSWPVDGKFNADLGFYNPHTKSTALNADEVKTWLDKGAKPSNTVAKIMLAEKLKHKSIVVVKKNRKPKKEVEAVAEKAVETPAPEAVVAEAVESPDSVEEEAPAEA